MNKKEQLIEKIVQSIVHRIDDISREQKNVGIEQYKGPQDIIRKILQENLPEDKEGDVVEIKRGKRNQTTQCECLRIIGTDFKACPGCGKKIKRID